MGRTHSRVRSTHRLAVGMRVTGTAMVFAGEGPPHRPWEVAPGSGLSPLLRAWTLSPERCTLAAAAPPLPARLVGSGVLPKYKFQNSRGAKGSPAG